ncbi:MAG: imidazoleglycerol-phosphate dehydratase HisB [archaeon]|jgi:imidazoleglycerol-phosphate dehydratase
MRTAKVERKTGETEISVELNLDGTGKRKIDTGIGFFDHMLDLFAKHGLFDLNITCKGDLQIDSHHTIEDVGIVMGTAFDKAIQDKKGIKRYGQRILPMDEVLCLCAVDFCGRPYLVMDAEFNNDKINDFATECVEEFFYGFTMNSKINLQLKIFNGKNDHHKVEAMFKAFARAMREACEMDPRTLGEIPSTKGVL